MLDQIKATLESAEYEYYGIRIDDGVEYHVGDRTADSRVWDDGDPTDETLDGTSCIGLRYNATVQEITTAIRLSGSYYGDRLYLIAGNEMEYGEDNGEYIIRDATVVAILTR